MTIETVVMTDRVAVPFKTKLNPLWWLVGPDGWNVPEINNGAPYLPEVKNIWLRRFYWFFCRNPLMNFVGFVIGVEDNNYKVVGPAPVLLTTLRDASPRQTGWKWSIILTRASLAALTMALTFVILGLTVHGAFWLPAVIAAAKAAGPLPFVGYYDGKYEAYLGWRPASGGFGFKFVKHAQG